MMMMTMMMIIKKSTTATTFIITSNWSEFYIFQWLTERKKRNCFIK